MLCVHLSQFSANFARDLFAARTPFGRLLDCHQVKRVVQARCSYYVLALRFFTRVWTGACSDRMPRLRCIGLCSGAQQHVRK